MTILTLRLESCYVLTVYTAVNIDKGINSGLEFSGNVYPVKNIVLLLLFFCCFTSTVNIKGYVGKVS